MFRAPLEPPRVFAVTRYPGKANMRQGVTKDYNLRYIWFSVCESMNCE